MRVQSLFELLSHQQHSCNLRIDSESIGTEVLHYVCFTSLMSFAWDSPFMVYPLHPPFAFILSLYAGSVHSDRLTGSLQITMLITSLIPYISSISLSRQSLLLFARGNTPRLLTLTRPPLTMNSLHLRSTTSTKTLKMIWNLILTVRQPMRMT